MIARKEKEELFSKSLNKIKYILKNKDKRTKQEAPLLSSIYSLEKRSGKINYKDSFMLLINLSPQYNAALEGINRGDFQQSTLESKDFWDDKMDIADDEKIKYYSFFVYRYLIELNPDIVYDFQQMQGMTAVQIRSFVKNL